IIAQLEPGPNPNGESSGGSTKTARGARESEAKPEPAKQKQGAPGGHVMPAAARLAADNQVDLATVRGSGPGGRVLKEDVQKTISAANGARPGSGGAREERRIPMSPIRQTIARRLVEAQQTAALLTTF